MPLAPLGLIDEYRWKEATMGMLGAVIREAFRLLRP
jgi:hypothetical protein